MRTQKIIRDSIASAVLSLFCCSARAGDVEIARPYWSSSDAEVTVRLHSDIKLGDLKKVTLAIKAAEANGKTVLALELDSYGGDGNVGLALAEFVRKAGVPVFVPDYCLSACSLIAASALGCGELMVSPEAMLGFHAAEDLYTGRRMRAWDMAAARQMRKLGAPLVMISAMLNTPHSDMVYFNAAALEMLGATLKERP